MIGKQMKIPLRKGDWSNKKDQDIVSSHLETLQIRLFDFNILE